MRADPTAAPTRHVVPYASIAPVYDRLIGDAALEPIWAGFRHSCRRHRVTYASVADVACGTGSFLAGLARTMPGDATLYGIDGSPAMLSVARRRLAGTPVRLLRQDMRALKLPTPVDLITCNFSSLAYLRKIKELQATLVAFYQNLCFNGVLIFDTMIGENAAPSGGAFRQIIALPDFRAQWDARPSADNRGSVVVMNSCVQHTRMGAVCSHERHVQRWWSRSLLDRLLGRAGLRVVGAHRLGDQRPAGPTDRWVQFVARRR